MPKKQQKGKTKRKLSNENAVDEYDLSVPLKPIGDYVKDRTECVLQMFSCVKGSQRKKMLPPILKKLPEEELMQLCIEELEVMSKQRIRAILAGSDLQSSSDSEDESDSDDEKDDSDEEQGDGDATDHTKGPSKRDKTAPMQPDSTSDLGNTSPMPQTSSYGQKRGRHGQEAEDIVSDTQGHTEAGQEYEEEEDEDAECAVDYDDLETVVESTTDLISGVTNEEIIPGVDLQGTDIMEDLDQMNMVEEPHSASDVKLPPVDADLAVDSAEMIDTCVSTNVFSVATDEEIVQCVLEQVIELSLVDQIPSSSVEPVPTENVDIAVDGNKKSVDDVEDAPNFGDEILLDEIDDDDDFTAANYAPEQQGSVYFGQQPNDHVSPAADVTNFDFTQEPAGQNYVSGGEAMVTDFSAGFNDGLPPVVTCGDTCDEDQIDFSALPPVFDPSASGKEVGGMTDYANTSGLPPIAPILPAAPAPSGSEAKWSHDRFWQVEAEERGRSLSPPDKADRTITSGKGSSGSKDKNKRSRADRNQRDGLPDEDDVGRRPKPRGRGNKQWGGGGMAMDTAMDKYRRKSRDDRREEDRSWRWEHDDREGGGSDSDDDNGQQRRQKPPLDPAARARAEKRRRREKAAAAAVAAKKADGAADSGDEINSGPDNATAVTIRTKGGKLVMANEVAGGDDDDAEVSSEEEGEILEDDDEDVGHGGGADDFLPPVVGVSQEEEMAALAKFGEPAFPKHPINYSDPNPMIITAHTRATLETRNAKKDMGAYGENYYEDSGNEEEDTGEPEPPGTVVAPLLPPPIPPFNSEALSAVIAKFRSEPGDGSENSPLHQQQMDIMQQHPGFAGHVDSQQAHFQQPVELKFQRPKTSIVPIKQLFKQIKAQKIVEAARREAASKKVYSAIDKPGRLAEEVGDEDQEPGEPPEGPTLPPPCYDSNDDDDDNNANKAGGGGKSTLVSEEFLQELKQKHDRLKAMKTSRQERLEQLRAKRVSMVKQRKVVVQKSKHEAKLGVLKPAQPGDAAAAASLKSGDEREGSNEEKGSGSDEDEDDDVSVAGSSAGSNEEADGSDGDSSSGHSDDDEDESDTSSGTGTSAAVKQRAAKKRTEKSYSSALSMLTASETTALAALTAAASSGRQLRLDNPADLLLAADVLARSGLGGAAVSSAVSAASQANKSPRKEGLLPTPFDPINPLIVTIKKEIIPIPASSSGGALLAPPAPPPALAAAVFGDSDLMAMPDVVVPGDSSDPALADAAAAILPAPIDETTGEKDFNPLRRFRESRVTQFRNAKPMPARFQRGGVLPPGPVRSSTGYIPRGRGRGRYQYNVGDGMDRGGYNQHGGGGGYHGSAGFGPGHMLDPLTGQPLGHPPRDIKPFNQQHQHPQSEQQLQQNQQQTQQQQAKGYGRNDFSAPFSDEERGGDRASNRWSSKSRSGISSGSSSSRTGSSSRSSGSSRSSSSRTRSSSRSSRSGSDSRSRSRDRKKKKRSSHRHHRKHGRRSGSNRKRGSRRPGHTGDPNTGVSHDPFAPPTFDAPMNNGGPNFDEHGNFIPPPHNPNYPSGYDPGACDQFGNPIDGGVGDRGGFFAGAGRFHTRATFVPRGRYTTPRRGYQQQGPDGQPTRYGRGGYNNRSGGQRGGRGFYNHNPDVDDRFAHCYPPPADIMDEDRMNAVRPDGSLNSSFDSGPPPPRDFGDADERYMGGPPPPPIKREPRTLAERLMAEDQATLANTTSGRLHNDSFTEDPDYNSQLPSVAARFQPLHSDDGGGGDGDFDERGGGEHDQRQRSPEDENDHPGGYRRTNVNSQWSTDEEDDAGIVRGRLRSRSAGGGGGRTVKLRPVVVAPVDQGSGAAVDMDYRQRSDRLPHRQLPMRNDRHLIISDNNKRDGQSDRHRNRHHRDDRAAGGDMAGRAWRGDRDERRDMDRYAGGDHRGRDDLDRRGHPDDYDRRGERPSRNDSRTPSPRRWQQQEIERLRRDSRERSDAQDRRGGGDDRSRRHKLASRDEPGGGSSGYYNSFGRRREPPEAIYASGRRNQPLERSRSRDDADMRRGPRVNSRERPLRDDRDSDDGGRRTNRQRERTTEPKQKRSVVRDSDDRRRSGGPPKHTSVVNRAAGSASSSSEGGDSSDDGTSDSTSSKDDGPNSPKREEQQPKGRRTYSKTKSRERAGDNAARAGTSSSPSAKSRRTTGPGQEPLLKVAAGNKRRAEAPAGDDYADGGDKDKRPPKVGRGSRHPKDVDERGHRPPVDLGESKPPDRKRTRVISRTDEDEEIDEWVERSPPSSKQPRGTTSNVSNRADSGRRDGRTGTRDKKRIEGTSDSAEEPRKRDSHSHSASASHSTKHQQPTSRHNDVDHRRHPPDSRNRTSDTAPSSSSAHREKRDNKRSSEKTVNRNQIASSSTSQFKKRAQPVPPSEAMSGKVGGRKIVIKKEVDAPEAKRGRSASSSDNSSSGSGSSGSNSDSSSGSDSDDKDQRTTSRSGRPATSSKVAPSSGRAREIRREPGRPKPSAPADSSAPSTSGSGGGKDKSQMTKKEREIYELEMRARAIKALMKSAPQGSAAS